MRGHKLGEPVQKWVRTHRPSTVSDIPIRRTWRSTTTTLASLSLLLPTASSSVAFTVGMVRTHIVDVRGSVHVGSRIKTLTVRRPQGLMCVVCTGMHTEPVLSFLTFEDPTRNARMPNAMGVMMKIQQSSVQLSSYLLDVR